MKQKTQSEVTVKANDTLHKLATGKNESKHTPGPWILGKPYKDSTNNTIYQVDVKLQPCEKCGSNGTYLIARTFKDAIGKGQAEANARLIAAAPDLIICLTELLSIHNDPTRGDLVWRLAVVEQCEKAIKKATK